MHTWSGKGYGFIRRDDKQPDVFAHISDVMEFMGDQSRSASASRSS